MSAKKKILVVGDWLVDEHWVVGRHRSDTASRSGRRHSRALQEARCSVRSLCGAGHVATILHNATKGKNALFNVVGCGLWNGEDDAELRRMLIPGNSNGVTPYSLSSRDARFSVESSKRVTLHNLAPKSLRKDIGTTRVIRVYEQTQNETIIRDRLDWERQLAKEALDAVERGLRDSVPTKKELEDCDFVVIKDLGKGVVTPSLIELLCERVSKGALWYVSSKDWRPKWYQLLPAERVRLVLIPQVAARKAIQDDVIHSSAWLTAGGHGTREAFSEIDSIADRFPGAIVLVLPNGMTLFGRSPKSMEPRLFRFTQTDFGDSQRLRVLPMASVFFPALLTQLAEARDTPDPGRLVQRALTFTDHWMKYEFMRLRRFDWNPLTEQDLSLDRQYDEQFIVRIEEGWRRSIEHWKQATNDNGVVTYRTSGFKTLQLWRAMTEVEGFVACVPDKRKALKRLIEQGRRFNRDRSQHFSFMLMDKPGTGKSYLVKCLARQLGMRMLEFNITQMLDRSDLVSMFDKIVTDQAQNPEESLLVFVDEINAKLDNQSVYSSFLAPLEDGIYVRGGNAVKIAPCFWVFAGTRPPRDPETEGKPHESDKGSDFQSRLTLSPFELLVRPTDKEHMDAASLERNYVAAATIQRIFPDVQKLSTLALNAFELLPPSIEPRAIARIVKTFQNVQYGRITSRNFPEGWHTEFEVDPAHIKEWEVKRGGGDEGDDIEIDGFALTRRIGELEVSKLTSLSSPAGATPLPRSSRRRSSRRGI